MSQIIKNMYTVSLVGLTIIGCTSSQNKSENSIPDPVVLQSPEPFINSDDKELMMVFYLNSLQNGDLVLADPGLMNIIVFDQDGSERYRFGNQGRGPGEITEISTFFTFNDDIYIGDRSQAKILRFNANGEYLSAIDYMTHRGSYGEAMLTDTLSYVSASMGQNGSLLKWHRPSADSVAFWGEAFGEEYILGDLSIQNDYLKRGEIPPSAMNSVRFTSDGSDVYVYLNAHAIVQKYDMNGNLIWQKDVDLPINELIFEDAVKRANELNMPGVSVSFALISGFKAIGGDVYILSNYLDGQDRSLLKVSADGDVEAHYTIPSGAARLFDFTVNPETQTLYLTAPETGEVYRVSLE